MKARVMMRIDGETYEYGCYNFNSVAERHLVNQIAIEIATERRCDTYVERVEEDEQ